MKTGKGYYFFKLEKRKVKSKNLSKIAILDKQREQNESI